MGMMAIHTRAIMANLKMVLTLLDADGDGEEGPLSTLGVFFKKIFSFMVSAHFP
jgi:hypothetical protein